MKFAASAAATMAIVVVLVISATPIAQANSVISLSVSAVMDAADHVSADNDGLVKVAHKTPRRNKVKRRRRRPRNSKPPQPAG